MAKKGLSCIATSDYVPLAELMLDSHAEHNSGYEYFIFLADDGLVESRYAIRALFSLVSDEEFRNLSRKYTLAELCYCFKPYVLSYMLDQGFDQAFYLDTDIYVYSRFEPIERMLAEHDILLTPHRAKPSGDPSADLVLHRAGTFNAGFLAVRKTEQAELFLQWWAQRTTQFGYNKTWEGMCGDQRWLDTVPIIFPTTGVLRHLGCNVGHWNLDERDLNDSAENPMIGADALIFFHFSGFQVSEPEHVSVHNEILVPENYRSLFRKYAERIADSGFNPEQKRLSALQRILASIRRRTRRLNR